ncbi:hypothetical protein V5799_003125 [Amblyomma americanum]|uniref:Activating transcription factor 7-interacting protein Fn3 domain-containing protein n=1 Tax=Amblyomma americanum TaxID=6943 RepID=A0AAQ4D9V3_AMBAM
MFTGSGQREPGSLATPGCLCGQQGNHRSDLEFLTLTDSPTLQKGLVLSWNMTFNSLYADIQTYQLYAYQETNAAPATSFWKKVGDVRALPLPMACTLTQFVDGHKYHFAVRAVDVHNRLGPFSDPTSILLK